ncbi:hypothetical protein CU669_18680 [Paramagnetospirillum kuznetsovii]|uniref:PPM-type phosphatase domain-containing protein n=1 Tax=Paramagnetospirillum kuznetsovii TaxID=2053833 RepID=A0A364NTD8_9PROT|nr:hypothetical protein [Paramagnetospirillum kuznetsovii]RAU20353.1 hypothetical protein CU669_18680 [Paramagnetospirillum kuznetsovii]
MAISADPPLIRRVAPMLTWTAQGRSIVKPRNDSYADGDGLRWRQNEDRLRLARIPDGLLAAVSDGAGGAGLFCGPWAETLVTRLPKTPIAGVKALNQWMDGFCLGFRAEYAALSKSTPARHSKFIREGSFATLVAGWLAYRQGRVRLRWMGYGDSQMMVFDRSGRQPVLAACYPASLSALERAPFLLNWKDLPRDASFHAGEMMLPDRATVVLASDGIGQYLLLRSLAGLPRPAAAAGLPGEFLRLAVDGESKLALAARVHRAVPGPGLSAELAALRDSLKSDQAFAGRVRALCDKGLLANDDCTLIMIDVDFSRSR